MRAPAKHARPGSGGARGGNPGRADEATGQTSGTGGTRAHTATHTGPGGQTFGSGSSAFRVGLRSVHRLLTCPMLPVHLATSRC